jgi:hypothetical protein
MSGRGGGYTSSPHNIRDVWVINPKNDRNVKVRVYIRVSQGNMRTQTVLSGQTSSHCSWTEMTN